MKVKISGFIHWHKYEWRDEPEYMFAEGDMSTVSPEYVVIMEHSFEVEIPDSFDPVPLQIKGLKDAKEKLLAETQAKVNNIDEQIQRLLCIEHKPELVA